VNKIDLTGAVWRKSSPSNGQANCVEVALLADGTVMVCNSKDHQGSVLTFTPGEWDAFIGGESLMRVQPSVGPRKPDVQEHDRPPALGHEPGAGVAWARLSAGSDSIPTTAVPIFRWSGQHRQCRCCGRRRHGPLPPRKCQAVSTPECILAGQELVEDLGRGSEAQGFARSAVEFGSNGIEVGLTVDGEVGAFREVLAE